MFNFKPSCGATSVFADGEPMNMIRKCQFTIDGMRCLAPTNFMRWREKVPCLSGTFSSTGNFVL